MTDPETQAPPSPVPGTSRGTAELYRLLVENVTDYAIFMLDPDGRVASWNEGAERILGYRDGEILGENVAVLYAPEDVEEGRPAADLRTAVEEGR
ncbi:MAG TPA: PAS domain-containing protein, partial [Longimicrobiaceae bacterium]